MINFYEVCNYYDIEINRVKIDKSFVFIYSNDKIYLIKKKCNKDIYSYFDSINFNGYINNIGYYNEYELCCFYEDKCIESYGKAKELILTLSDLHNKSHSYIDFDTSRKEDIYNVYKNKINECMNYYLKLQDSIEEMEFILPQYYLLLINISKFYKLLHFASSKLDEFYNIDSIHIRDVMLVGNLSLDNYCCGEKKYFIDYSLSKRDYLVYDLVSFYRNNYLNLDCKSLIDYYDSLIHLNDEERNLFLLIISIPNIIEFNHSNFDNTFLVRNEINYVLKTMRFVLEENKENQKAN